MDYEIGYLLIYSAKIFMTATKKKKKPIGKNIMTDFTKIKNALGPEVENLLQTAVIVHNVLVLKPLEKDEISLSNLVKLGKAYIKKVGLDKRVWITLGKWDNSILDDLAEEVERAKEAISEYGHDEREVSYKFERGEIEIRIEGDREEDYFDVNMNVYNKNGRLIVDVTEHDETAVEWLFDWGLVSNFWKYL